MSVIYLHNNWNKSMSYQVWFQNNIEKINNLLDGVSDLGADESKTHNYYDDLKGDLELFANLEAHILSAKDTDFEVIFKSISSIFDIIKNRNLQGFDRIKNITVNGLLTCG